MSEILCEEILFCNFFSLHSSKHTGERPYVCDGELAKGWRGASWARLGRVFRDRNLQDPVIFVGMKIGEVYKLELMVEIVTQALTWWVSTKQVARPSLIHPPSHASASRHKNAQFFFSSRLFLFLTNSPLLRQSFQCATKASPRNRCTPITRSGPTPPAINNLKHRVKRVFLFILRAKPFIFIDPRL